MLSLDNICLNTRVAPGLLQNLSPRYNHVYWVLQISILEKTHSFLVFLRKMKEKKLLNDYEPLFISKGL